LTSRVTIDAHAGWHIQVIMKDYTGQEIQKNIVEPYTEQQFHVWNGVYLEIKEMNSWQPPKPQGSMIYQVEKGSDTILFTKDTEFSSPDIEI
jgi:hypothetical protein